MLLYGLLWKFGDITNSCCTTHCCNSTKSFILYVYGSLYVYEGRDSCAPRSSLFTLVDKFTGLPVGRSGFVDYVLPGFVCTLVYGPISTIC